MEDVHPAHHSIPSDRDYRYCEANRRALESLHMKGYCAGFNGKSPLGSIVAVMRPFFSTLSPALSQDPTRSFQTARRVVRGVAHAYGLSLDEIAFTGMDVYQFSPAEGFRNLESQPLKETPDSLWFRFSFPGMDDSVRRDLNEKTYHLLTTHPDPVLRTI